MSILIKNATGLTDCGIWQLEQKKETRSYLLSAMCFGAFEN